MLGSVGRFIAILLVVLVAALAARAFFEDSRSPDETLLPAALPPPPLPVLAPPMPQPAKRVTLVDPDPDLDQSVEPADCLGTPEPPVEPEPKEPAPH
jgi:hypothetical protein